MILYAYTFAAGFVVGIGIGAYQASLWFVRDRKQEARRE